VDLPLREQLQSLLTGAYVVERELGRGGMGAVFLARDLRLDRPVAIKVLPPELAVQEQLRERFLRETRTAAALSHPNIVPVHAVEQRDSLLLFVMGFVEGETLTQRVAREGPLSAMEAMRVIQEVAWALSYAHGRGVVHRDVKPDNILIERATGRAMVMDFGIARSAAATALTTLGEVVGTPHFMSPEQAAGEAVDGRSDLYSLGIVAFFALTGRRPFEGDSAQAILAMHLTRPAPHLADERPDLPAALSAAVDRCLAKDPADRFPNGEALVAALEPLRANRREVAPPVRLFLERARHSARGMVVILALIPALTMHRAPGDAMAFVILMLAMAGALARSVLQGARELVRVGFRYDDVRDATELIAEERRETQARFLASPDARRHAIRQRRWRIVSMLAGAASIVLAFVRFRSRVSPTEYLMTGAGVALLILGEILIASAFVAMITDPTRSHRLESRGQRFWLGWPGRTLFRLATRGIEPSSTRATRAAQQTGTASATPLAVLANLPKPLRAELAQLEEPLERLDAALAALDERGAALDAALAEAHEATPAAPGALAR
jgi:serine/threonine-protein kinase